MKQRIPVWRKDVTLKHMAPDQLFGEMPTPRPTSPENSRYRDWLKWLTPMRLERWNHLRSRALQEPITAEQGAELLVKLKPDVIEEIKEWIAE